MYLGCFRCLFISERKLPSEAEHVDMGLSLFTYSHFAYSCFAYFRLKKVVFRLLTKKCWKTINNNITNPHFFLPKVGKTGVGEMGVVEQVPISRHQQRRLGLPLVTYLKRDFSTTTVVSSNCNFMDYSPHVLYALW